MSGPSSTAAHSSEQFEETTQESAGAPERPSAWRDLALALSIAHLLFIQGTYGLLIERTYGYYNRIPVNQASLAALLLNIFGAGFALWVIGRFVRHVNRPALYSLANLVVCAAALVPLNFARVHIWNVTAKKLPAVLSLPVLVIVAAVGALAVLWFHRRAAKILMVIYILVSPMVLLTAGKVAWYILRASPAQPESLASPTAPKAGAPQVVWLLFDELDQRIAFDARPTGVAMPELTRLSAECFHATNAFPPAGATKFSLPALTTGREVRQAFPIAPGELGINDGGRWSEADTVFSRARSLGFSTAAVGWFHPYGRVLGRHLERCEWYPYPLFEQERGRTIREALLNQLCSLFAPLQYRRLHIQNVQASEAAALQFLTNSPTALTLLHLPVPHYPGIYDPVRDQFTAWRYSRRREYMDNLALTDKMFGTLRRAMEHAGTWDKAWVIVSSDHWWRESASYDGKTDHRVPFIIKAPGQNQPVIYDKKFNTLLTYHLILSMLKGDITTAAELPHWVDTFRTDPPAGYNADGAPL